MLLVSLLLLLPLLLAVAAGGCLFDVTVLLFIYLFDLQDLGFVFYGLGGGSIFRRGFAALQGGGPPKQEHK